MARTARLGVICRSARADIDRKWEKSVLRCGNHGRSIRAIVLPRDRCPSYKKIEWAGKDSSPHLKECAFEILCLGHGKQDRVVLCLGPQFNKPRLSACLLCCCSQRFNKRFPLDVI